MWTIDGISRFTSSTDMSFLLAKATLSLTVFVRQMARLSTIPSAASSRPPFSLSQLVVVEPTLKTSPERWLSWTPLWIAKLSHGKLTGTGLRWRNLLATSSMINTVFTTATMLTRRVCRQVPSWRGIRRSLRGFIWVNYLNRTRPSEVTLIGRTEVMDVKWVYECLNACSIYEHCGRDVCWQ